MSTLGDRLRHHAREAPDTPAVFADERWWSYRELVAAAERLALGARPGDVVAIAIDRGIAAVRATCAAVLAGAVPAIIDPADPALAARTIAALRPAIVVTAPEDADLPGARVIHSGAPGQPVAPPTPLPWQPIARSTAIAHIIFTSGSTAEGKGVVWSDLRARYDWLIGTPTEAARRRPSAIVVPLCTSLGFHELVRSLYHGTRTALLDAPFPAAIAMARELAVHRIKLTPTHVELLLATAEQLPALEAITVATAPIAPDRLRALAAHVPSAQICRSYGLSESGAATMIWLHRKPGKLHTVGRPVGYRRVTVRDDTGGMLPPGRVGEVVVELPMWDADDGYLDASPELARRFSNGALWTGDRGQLDEQGFLVLGARTAEILKVGGRSVGAPRIEEVLASAEGIAEVAVVGVPDRLLGEVPCAVFVPAPGHHRVGDGDAAVAMRADEQPRWFLARRALPRNPSGKLRRGLLAQEAAAWTQAFPSTVIPAFRAYPAIQLEGGAAILDGCPAAWIGDTAQLDPCARIIALVARQPRHPLALAIVQAGASRVAATTRFIVGPIAVEPTAAAPQVSDLLDAFARELIELASRLPGPRSERTCAYPTAATRALTDAGFAPLDGHAGWLARTEHAAPSSEVGLASPERSRTPEPELPPAALREVAAAAQVLARAALEPARHRHDAGNPRS